MSKAKKSGGRPAEIAVVGEVDDWEADVVKALLEKAGGRSERTGLLHRLGRRQQSLRAAGGADATAAAAASRASAVVLGECSSAALLLFAACERRQVTRYSTLMFHRMRWQSDKRVASHEAFHWAKHFEDMEKDIDDLQIRLFGGGDAQVREWTAEGRYVTGPQLVEAGLAEMLELG